MLTAEEQQDFDSFALASPSVTLSRGRAPLWKFSEENTKFYSQAQTQAQTIGTKPIIRSQAQPLVSQAQTQAQAQAQPPQLAQAQSPQLQCAVPMLI